MEFINFIIGAIAAFIFSRLFSFLQFKRNEKKIKKNMSKIIKDSKEGKKIKTESDDDAMKRFNKSMED